MKAADHQNRFNTPSDSSLHAVYERGFEAARKKIIDSYARALRGALAARTDNTGFREEIADLAESSASGDRQELDDQLLRMVLRDFTIQCPAPDDHSKTNRESSCFPPLRCEVPAEVWQDKFQEAQEETIWSFGDLDLPRIPVAASVAEGRCPNCDAPAGTLHIFNCGEETCPNCRALCGTCDCLVELNQFG